MAIDFPNSPTLNQTFTGPNGIIWQWDGVKWTAIPATNPSVGAGNIGRNLLHNPLFNVAQRGAGPFTFGSYNADRWQTNVSGGTLSVSQLALVDADRAVINDESAKYASQTVFTGGAGASDGLQFCQKIEDVGRLSGKTITVSFWAKATAGTPKIAVEIYQSFGSGGSPSGPVVAIGSQAITLSTTWTRYTSTPIAIPSIAGKTLGTNGDTCTVLNFWLSAGTTLATRAANIGVQSYTLQIWGVQLEIGTQATPLDKPYDYGADVSNCMRFYQVLGPLLFAGYPSGAANNFWGTYTLPVEMRATPTATFAGTAYSNANTVSLNGASSTVIQLTALSTAGGVSWCQTNALVSADL